MLSRVVVVYTSKPRTVAFIWGIAIGCCHVERTTKGQLLATLPQMVEYYDVSSSTWLGSDHYLTLPGGG